MPAPAQPGSQAREDRALLAAAAGGDAIAVRRLLDETGPTVYGFVFARVGGDESVAEDVVQDTFLEAVKSASSFRGDAALTTWLCTIARRRVARHFEAERRRAVAESGLHVVAGTDEDAARAADDVVVDREEVIAALGALSPIHRQVLVLKYLDGLTVAAIAEEVRRTRVQVQSLLQRARAALKMELEHGRD